MDKATEVLDHMGHAAHAEEHGHHVRERFSTWIGITMAVLGVLLAFASAKVAGERTELVKSLVEQQNAHAKYQAQDIKHRAAVLSLRQLHATIPAQALAALKNATDRDSRARSQDIVLLARTAERYLNESTAAREWLESFDPLIYAHVEGQEYYEYAMLASEIGIVIASVALLLRMRMAWYISIILGLVSVAIMAVTFSHTSGLAHSAERKIEETDKIYRDLRTRDKMTAIDQQLLDDVYSTLGVKSEQPAAAHEK